jgi:hypothetical protein
MTEGVSAYEQKIDGLLERIEAQFSKIDDTLAFAKTGAENGAAARADAACAARDAAACRSELKEANGAVSDLQVGLSTVVADVAEIKTTLTAFRAEFQKGFAELWKRLLPDEPGEEQAGVVVASIHPIRQHENAE